MDVPIEFGKFNALKEVEHLICMEHVKILYIEFLKNAAF